MPNLESIACKSIEMTAQQHNSQGQYCQTDGKITIEYVHINEDIPKTGSFWSEYEGCNNQDAMEATRQLPQDPANFSQEPGDLMAEAMKLEAAAQNLRENAKTMSVVANTCLYVPALPICFVPLQQSIAPALAPVAQQCPLNLVGSSCGQAMQPSVSDGPKTTVMWQNIPNNYRRDDLLQLINSMGFDGSYDFFYSPFDFDSDALVGYAFVNFVSTYDANRFYEQFQGFNGWSLKSEKVSKVTWSAKLQGLEEHLWRYRNSPVMHHDVPEDRRPLYFKNGLRAPFPAPTKPLCAPKQKVCRPSED